MESKKHAERIILLPFRSWHVYRDEKNHPGSLADSHEGTNKKISHTERAETQRNNENLYFVF